MASIYKRKNQNGTTVWRAVIRIKGYPSVSNHFDRKQEAEDWASETERQIRYGQYRFGQENHRHKTLSDLIDRYIEDGVLDRHKAAKDTKRQLEYFRSRLGSYALVYITADLLYSERKALLEEVNSKGLNRNPATVNRYFATLSGALRYAKRQLRWTEDNPCSSLLPLKIKPKSRRVLSEEEEKRLLIACFESSSLYLYCIVLIALTTGARKSEILNLEWNDIDFENGIALFRETKNGRSRSVALVPSVVAELKKIEAERDFTRPKVFASKTSFGKVDIKKSWQSALKKAEIENFVFHGLRHHYCSLGGRMGATGSQLRAQLGHSSSRMTDHYSHLEAESARFIGESIEDRLLKD